MEACEQEVDSELCEAESERSKILIHLLEGNAFVWNAEDARKIREKHGLMGKLVGALVRKPMQNTRLGLPLELLPEETRLLVEIGAATLVCRCFKEKKHAHPSNSPMDGTSPSSTVPEEESSKAGAEVFQNFLKNSYKEQRRLAVEEKRRTLESLSETIMKFKNKRKHGEQEEPMESSSHGPINELQNLEETFNFPEEAMMVQIPTAQTSIQSIEEVDLCKASPDWPYIGQKKHELRFKVFRDLWQKGYYLTSGSKFGGDFLVYPGDPMRFHAHYIAICFPQDEEIALSDIITAGRLGTNVKKTVLLCSSNQEGLVTYTSLQWSGMQ
ncbi:PREDICTED: tRNA-splicing endonuclease subunit Sen34 [Nanorana parkeri]|uniref:tRNA-splicing endonuclease subunit Sen34 n=1 Tax=Nanorana parkeri TaxID=125878 RepID=UPI00085404F2|nr:PREDICTED: tRNA-splicing endonuclease subunit Sen34 [Nanorana parkeri]